MDDEVFFTILKIVVVIMAIAALFMIIAFAILFWQLVLGK